MNDEIAELQQRQEFLSFFEYVLKDQVLFDQFMSVLDDYEEMIIYLLSMGFHWSARLLNQALRESWKY